MSRPYKTKRTYNHNERIYEFIDEPSQTVQTEIMTMRETLARYQEGLSPEPKQVQYLDVDEIEEINAFYHPGALDLTDLDALNSKVSRLQEIVEEAHSRKVRDDIKQEEIEQANTQKVQKELRDAESE